MSIFSLPLLFLKFWFYESPVEMVKFFSSLNKAFLHLFSLPLFLRTFFKPLKNEYRPGLVGFSRAFGIIIKSFVIAVDIFLLVLLVTFELFVFASYIFLPIATIWLVFL